MQPVSVRPPLHENVSTEMLQKICSALDCDIADIIEIEKKQNN